MKYNYTICTLALSALLLSSSCGNTDHAKKTVLPGTIVAEASEPITADTLNKFTYSIRVIADSSGARGGYKVESAYGPNIASSKFTMPKGIEDNVPMLRKGPGACHYIVGFKLPDDTTFYTYYDILATSTTTKMAYINSYSFK